jgi:hypothetical protein
MKRVLSWKVTGTWMKNPRHSREAGFILALVICPVVAFANGGGVLFNPDADILGAQPWGQYLFMFDNREYSPLILHSPEERTIFGQDVRLGLRSTYQNHVELSLGIRLWQSFGEPLSNAVTLYPDIYGLLYWDKFSFLGGQFRTEDLHPAVFFMNTDAPDLPGIKLELGDNNTGGNLFLARTQVPGDLLYETYAGGGQFWWGSRDWAYGYDSPPKNSLRLQWSGVHQAGFDTGGQHYLVPPGDRKRESYAALGMGSLVPWQWLQFRPAAGMTLSRESGNSGMMAGLELSAGLELGWATVVGELSGWYLGNNFQSFWARDDFAVLDGPQVSVLDEDPFSQRRYMPGAKVTLYVPVDYFHLELGIDERFRFLNTLGGEKEWDRNRVVIAAGLDL